MFRRDSLQTPRWYSDTLYCWLVVSNIFYFTPSWGRFPIWLIFFKGVETTNWIGSDSAKSLQFYWPESWSILCRASERNMFFGIFFGMPESSSLVLWNSRFFCLPTCFSGDEKLSQTSVMNGISNASFPICQHCRWFLQDFSPKKSPLFFFFRLGNPPSISQLSWGWWKCDNFSRSLDGKMKKRLFQPLDK